MKIVNIVLGVLVLIAAVVSAVFSYFLYEKRVALATGWNQLTEAVYASAKTLDMTQGNSLKLILTFAVPLLMGTLFQQIYTTVDTMVVGHVLGDEAISAIGSTSSIHMLLFNLAISLNSGYAIITTQAFGAHDEEKLRRSIAGMFVLDTIAVALLTLVAMLFLRTMMMFMNTPESVFEQSYRYVMTLFFRYVCNHWL